MNNETEQTYNFTIYANPYMKDLLFLKITLAILNTLHNKQNSLNETLGLESNAK